MSNALVRADGGALAPATTAQTSLAGRGFAALQQRTTAKQIEDEAERLFQQGMDCWFGSLSARMDEPIAIIRFEKSASQGNLKAKFAYGLCCAKAATITEHKERGRTLLLETIDVCRDMAKKGDAIFQFFLGSIEYTGYISRKNEESAASWFDLAATSNLSCAQFMAGRCYYLGIGINKNIAKAEDYYLKSANQGNAIAQNNLAGLYLQKEDSDKAEFWYKRSIEQNYECAQKNLDDLNAFRTLIEAAGSHSTREVEFAIGRAYDLGRGTKSCDVTASIWFEKAANKGHAESQFFLAYSLQHGKGTAKDIDKSVYWYQKAAAQGYVNAYEKLEELKNASPAQHQTWLKF